MSDKPLITVKSRVDRFRRAGILFSANGTEIDPSALTSAQLRAIRDEPNLVTPSDFDGLVKEKEAQEAAAQEAAAADKKGGKK